MVLNKEEKLVGVINNIDIIKGLTSLDINTTYISGIMNKSPISISKDLSSGEIIRKLEKSKIKIKGIKDLTGYIPIVNSKNKVVNVLDIYTLLA